MNKITLLPEEVANKIAAGEVIERLHQSSKNLLRIVSIQGQNK